ncbi:MAG: DUF58 domain-containing protein [Pseudomonadaceae bacterium]|nr:DUF58 domain-containing protein [Pseudomonadaceae bacterium]
MTLADANTLGAKEQEQQQEKLALSVTLPQLQALAKVASNLHLNKLLSKNCHRLGGRNGPAIGRGLEFREVRGYQAGDDLRHLDWKVTARRGQPYTRVFHEEYQRPVMLFVDLASQLQFGQVGSKAVLAAKVAALLGWSALQDKDLVGAWIETDQQSYWQPPVKQARAFSPFLARLATISQNLGKLQPRAAGQLDKALKTFVQRLPKGSLVILISDWVGWTDANLIKRLAKQGPLLVVHLTDPLDKNLPSNAGAVVLQGKVQPVTPALQTAWQATFLQRSAALKAAAGQQASYLHLSTINPSNWLKPLF